MLIFKDKLVRLHLACFSKDLYASDSCVWNLLSVIAKFWGFYCLFFLNFESRGNKEFVIDIILSRTIKTNVHRLKSKTVNNFGFLG